MKGGIMQRNSILIISLISINIILVIICGFFYIKKDRSEPKIAFEANETVYTVGIDTNDLLTGMTAVDNKDGDISDRIVIEKILENKDKNVAVVYYAVCDYDGNVAKASREFPARFDLLASAQVSDSANNADTDTVEEQQDEEAKAAEEAAKAEEEARLAEEEAQRAAEEAAQAEEEARKAEEEAKAAEEAKKAEEEAKKAEEEAKKSDAEKKAEEEKKAAEAAAAAAEAAKKSASAPYIELKYTECKVPIGGGIPWADAIKTLKDDKDGYEALFRNLIASKFDNSKTGDAKVTLYTTDSDKNKSNTVTMTVHVVQ